MNNETRARLIGGPVLAVAYVATVVLANVLTEHYGLVTVGFGLVCTAGTFAAGAALLARNALQTVGGRWLTLVLMAAGVALTWWLATPTLAVASGVAFTLSESTDMAVFTALERRGWARAALVSSAVAAVVDTFAFLRIAGFPLTAQSVTGQLVVKVGISWAVVALVGIAVTTRRRVAA